MIFYGFVVFIVLIDQIFKALVNKFMGLGETVSLVPGLVDLTYVRNTGAAFSLFVGFSPYLVVVGLVVVAVVAYFHHRLTPKNLVAHTALAFIMGGSIGNLVDRIFLSYVIDYIDFRFWPVFNFADIMINVGVVIFLLFVFEEEKEEIKEEREEKQFVDGLDHTCCED